MCVTCITRKDTTTLADEATSATVLTMNVVITSTGSDGVFELSNIPPGDFTLRVVAVDPFINDAFNPHRRAITRNRLWVHGDDTFCVVHVRNDGVSVDENTMTIDFYSTGEPSGFLCSFDRGEFFECECDVLSKPTTLSPCPSFFPSLTPSSLSLFLCLFLSLSLSP